MINARQFKFLHYIQSKNKLMIVKVKQGQTDTVNALKKKAKDVGDRLT